MTESNVSLIGLLEEAEDELRKASDASGKDRFYKLANRIKRFIEKGLPEPAYEWNPIETVPKDGTCVILYFSLGTCRIPYVARYKKGHMDGCGVMNWETIRPNPAGEPSGWLPIIWKDYI